MKVVILCGGKGSRIRDMSEDMPKPMIPIGGAPIVKHIMEIYARHGHKEFVLCLGYKGWKIKEYFLNYQSEIADIRVDLSGKKPVEILDDSQSADWSVILAETGIDAMTGCRVKRIQKYIGDETFMLTYGDGVGNIDISALADFHGSHGKLATITSVRPPSRFGELVLDGDDVTAFEEKPQTGVGFINGGFLVCDPGVFDYLEDEEECTFEREPLQNLARNGQLATYKHEGFWMPMDTAREYALLNEMWNSGTCPWNPDQEHP